MGQHYLALLAKSAGLVVNSSNDDKAGWDFELETASPTTVDYRSHSKPLYRIQVKSTRGALRSVTMSFSSLVSLIRFAGPSFLFFARFGSDSSPVPLEARLLHIDKAVARDILTKMRKKEVAAGTSFKINKASTSVSFSSAASVDLQDGGHLRALLAQEVGSGYLDYVSGKTKWLQEFESESRALRFKVWFENESAVEAMARSLLGYDAPISVDTVHYYAPMGIPDEQPRHTGVFLPTVIKPVEESIRNATVTLKAREFGASYSFSARVYSNLDMVPAAFEGVRVHASIFDIALKANPLDVRLDFPNLDDPDLLVPIRDLKNFMAFIDEASVTDVTHTYLVQ